MAEPALIRVLVADDEPRIRRAIVDVIGAAGTMQVVAAVDNADEAVRATASLRPDVLVVDDRLAGGGGARVARELATASPSTRIVALADDDDAASVTRMLRAGAIGYVVKGAPIDELVEAIDRAARGLGSLSSNVASQVAETLDQQLRALEQAEERHLERLHEVRRALEPDVIVPVFQPIVGLATGHVVGYEALARFELTPDRPPDAWFNLANGFGALEQLELAAIRAAIDRSGHLPGDSYLSLNLSPMTVTAADLPDALLGIPPERVVLEITEHAVVADYAVLAQSLAPLRARGARVAVDDAGAGFASLHHILQLQPDIIKLDISITRNVSADRSRRALATALASFGDSLGIDVVAEGIETAAEMETLRELGVRYGQGYLLGRPVGAPALEA